MRVNSESPVGGGSAGGGMGMRRMLRMLCLLGAVSCIGGCASGGGGRNAGSASETLAPAAGALIPAGERTARDENNLFPEVSESAVAAVREEMERENRIPFDTGERIYHYVMQHGMVPFTVDEVERTPLLAAIGETLRSASHGLERYKSLHYHYAYDSDKWFNPFLYYYEAYARLEQDQDALLFLLETACGNAETDHARDLLPSLNARHLDRLREDGVCPGLVQETHDQEGASDVVEAATGSAQ